MILSYWQNEGFIQETVKEMNTQAHSDVRIPSGDGVSTGSLINI